MANEPCNNCSQVAQSLAQSAPPPAAITNRSGLSSLAYRLGARASFLVAMKARLATMPVEVSQPAVAGGQADVIYPLSRLTTRDPGDPAIALLDGWANAADVLTFYQERIANEGYLRTATQRRSILELARLVGYTLRPGVASNVFLAYTIDPLHVGPVEIPAGARSQSVPGPGELPQSFETSEKLIARAEWSELKPRLTRPQTLRAEAKIIYLQGTTTNLKPGDPLLIGPANGSPALRYVAKVELKPNALDPTKSYTEVTLQATGSTPPPSPSPNPGEARANRILEALKDLLADLDRPGLFINQNTKQRIVMLLQSLAKQLRSDPTDKNIDDAVKITVEKLRTERERAEAKLNFPLAAWLAKAIDGIEKAAGPQSTLPFARDASLAAVSMAGNGNGSALAATATAASSFINIDRVVSRLVAPPSVPPTNTLRLGRDLGTAFAAGSDLGLQATGISNAALPNLLAKALTQATAEPLLKQEVMALRVRARPDGHNAPVKQIKNNEGQITGLMEWPLFGWPDLQVVVKLTVGTDTAQKFSADSVKVTYTAEKDVIDANLDSTKTNASLKDLRITASWLSGNDLVKVDFVDTSQRAILSVTFSHNKDDLMVKVAIPGKTPVPSTLKLKTQDVQIIDDRRQVAIAYEEGAGGRQGVLQTGFLGKVLALDAPYDQVIKESWVALVRPGDAAGIVTQVKSIASVSTIDYDFPARVTQLTLNDSWLVAEDKLLSDIRNVTVFAQSETLELAEVPITDVIGPHDKDKGETVELDSLYSGFETGRWMIVCGERADILDADNQPIPGIRACERVMLLGATQTGQPPADASDRQQSTSFGLDEENGKVETGGATPPEQSDSAHTILQFAKPLAFPYLRDTVTIYGNVVKATHGETRNETLGGGDGSKAFQTFALRQFPLTYVSADTPEGAASTLKVYVNDVEWHEAKRLADLDPSDRSFLTSTGDDDKTSITFGDGEHGARPPTGAANVKAVYRNGIGRAGNVAAEQISLLMTRPLGVKGVINPQEASDGADRETHDEARRNVPLALLALDRLVSVQDYADFSRTFAGIGKAAAARLPSGRSQVLHVTVAGAGDAPIKSSDDLYHNLLAALRKYGDPDLAIQLDARELVLVVISACIRLLPDYQWERVVTAVRNALLDTLSFEKRDLGQPVYASEVVGAIQTVPGVAYVDLDAFGGAPEMTADGKRPLTPDEVNDAMQLVYLEDEIPVAVPAQAARANPYGKPPAIRPAQLAILVPGLPETLILNRIEG
jgi:hypothetical protein